eukprot:jgi/Botrbrau1/23547/Bobra.0141s0018.1
MAASGVEKQLEKLRATVDSGASYEALQIVKTVYHRYRSRKKMLDSYQLLEEAAIMLLNRGQVTGGLELALLLVEAYVTDGVPSDKAAVQRILRIFDALGAVDSSASQPSSSDAASTAANSSEKTLYTGAIKGIATAAIKWARKAPPSAVLAGDSSASAAEPYGGNEAVLQLYRAHAHWLTARLGPEGLAVAVPLYARGHDIEGLAKALDAAAVGAPAEERELFLVRAILQMLVAAPSYGLSQAIAQSRQLMLLFQVNEELEGSPGDLSPGLKTVAWNFVDLLLKALERRSPRLELVVRTKYSRLIEMDEDLVQLMDRVEKTHVKSFADPGFDGMLKSLGNLFGPMRA